MNVIGGLGPLDEKPGSFKLIDGEGEREPTVRMRRSVKELPPGQAVFAGLAALLRQEPPAFRQGAPDLRRPIRGVTVHHQIERARTEREGRAIVRRRRSRLVDVVGRGPRVNNREPVWPQPLRRDPSVRRMTLGGDDTGRRRNEPGEELPSAGVDVEQAIGSGGGLSDEILVAPRRALFASSIL